MPLWAGVVTAAYWLFKYPRRRWRIIYVMSAIGITSHILLDLLTVFGTRVFYPVSDVAFSFGTTFVVDLLATSIIAISLVVSLRYSRQFPAWGGLVLLASYLGLQFMLKSQALTIAEDQVPKTTEVYVLPQPFLPFNWKLIRRTDDGYSVAHLNLLADPVEFEHVSYGNPLSSYRSRKNLHWQPRLIFGLDSDISATAAEAWVQPQFTKFRQFTRFPVLYRVDQKGTETCVWFADMRYELPFLPPAFRYGLCRTEIDAPWQLYRLTRFSETERRPIPPFE